MFPDDYLELIGVADETVGQDDFRTAIETGGEGLKRIAFASHDSDHAAAQLRTLGVQAEGPVSLVRALELPGGAVLPEFDLVQFPVQALAGVNGFVCCHLSPDIVRADPAWLRHANGACGVAGVFVAAEDPVTIVQAFERLQPGSVDGRVVRLGPHWLAVHTPDEWHRKASAFHPPALGSDGVALFAVSLLSHDMVATRRYFADREIEVFDDAAQDAMWIQAEAACGVALVFSHS